MAEIVSVSGADRVATVWVDEYGAGLIHPYVVLDLLSDTPRRSFSMEPLRRAWEIGVPGAHDDVVPSGSTGATTFAIALGSDGARAWFVVADSVSPRPALDGQARDRLMFLAGECSAIALHRDLDRDGDADPAAEGRFAGWSILQDIEDRKDDEAEGSRIAQRFIAARIVRMLVDDDLVMSQDRVVELAQGARREMLDADGLEPEELALWTDLLDAFEEQRLEDLGSILVDLAEASEERGHVHGAVELYRCAFSVATAVGKADNAINSARYLGRIHRRRASRDEGMKWYETAHEIATAARADHLAALALSGIGVTRQELGNIPGAREIMNDGLALALRSGNSSTVSELHRALVTVEISAKDAPAALEHGWKAVGASESAKDRMRCMATLAGTLEWAGDYDVAADAWNIVAAGSGDQYFTVLALDALAHISALRGDETGFADYAERCDAMGHESIHSAHAQILHYRGLSYRALGRFDEAAEWLGRAAAFAEAHRFNETMFKAEEALAGLESYVVETVQPKPAAPPSVRDGVKAMRQDLVGV